MTRIGTGIFTRNQDSENPFEQSLPSYYVKKLYRTIADPMRHNIVCSEDAIAYHERKAQHHARRADRNSRGLNPVFGKHSKLDDLDAEEVLGKPLGSWLLISLAYNRGWELYHFKKAKEMSGL